MRHHLSVVAAVAVLGLGSAACGSGTNASSTTSHPRRTLAVLGSRSAGGEKAAADLGGITTEPPTASLYPLRWPPTFVIDGQLPSLATEAKVYSITGGDADAVAVAKVAKALGLDGQVTEVGSVAEGNGEWVVTAGTRSLHVSKSSSMSWYMWDSAGPGGSISSGCATKPGDPAAPDSPSTPSDCTVVTPTRPSNLPSADEAKQRALKVAQNLGIDTSNAVVRVDDAITQWSVAIDPQIGGVPTQGYGLYLGVGPAGKVIYGSGFLGRVSVVDSYPLVTPAEGLKRLVDQQYMTGGVGDVVATKAAGTNPAPPETSGGSGGSGGSGSTPSAVPGDTGTGSTAIETKPAPDSTGTSGPSTTLAPWVVHITGVRIVLLPRWLSATEVLMVPAYEYTTADSLGTWLAIAVADEFLAPAAPVVVPAIGPDTPVSASVVTATSTAAASKP